ncbi:hypothetical protein [Undibacterium danionis]|uniref:Uncharacterized protein n=1 Tax=Undibacterium danionis TaxID=1812100 RepID=A0ABV6IFC1_9BURK
MFFRNLNVFIACLLVGGMTLAAPVGMFMSIALMAVIGSKYATVAGYYLGYAILAATLAFFWWKGGLSPVTRKQDREGRFNFGHNLLGLTNVVAIGALAGPILLAQITKNSDLAMYAWFSIPVYMFGFLAWPVGLFMVWSSRA